MVVAELISYRAPLALVLLCVVLGFHPRLHHEEAGSIIRALVHACVLDNHQLLQDYDYLELFAGAGEVSGKLCQDISAHGLG